MAVVEGILAGDEARDHARVGGLDVAPDQREPHAGHRLHAETLHHMDMGMAAANQNEILQEGRGLHPDSYIRSELALVQS